MLPEALINLLNQNESATLECKREWYKMNRSMSPEGWKRERDEMIKDILSLANGSATTVGEKAYLIIGASDTLNPDGSRDLFDVDTTQIDKGAILKTVNSACDPPLEDIEVIPLELNGKQLVIITIWPTPTLIETTRTLILSKTKYHEHVVFTRRDEHIGVASIREREAIVKLKQIHHAESRKVSPLKYGILVGAISGAIALASAANADADTSLTNFTIFVIRLLLGAILGTFIGGLVGWNALNYIDINYELNFYSKRQKYIFIAVVIIGFIAFCVLLRTMAGWPILRILLGE
ncbi:MAG: RNA-binding domain-containing protein [Chloroflexota bacterium]